MCGLPRHFGVFAVMFCMTLPLHAQKSQSVPEKTARESSIPAEKKAVEEKPQKDFLGELLKAKDKAPEKKAEAKEKEAEEGKGKAAESDLKTIPRTDETKKLEQERLKKIYEAQKKKAQEGQKQNNGESKQ